MKLTPPQPPERIYGWFNSQLSIARHYGGCTYQGARYVVTSPDPDQPLVRFDVLEAERKAQRVANKAEKLAAKAEQGDLL